MPNARVEGAPDFAPGRQLDADDDFHVELAQVLFRHGDRAPILNAMAGDPTSEEEERDFWQAKLPDEEVLEMLDAFPLASANPANADGRGAPFGRLTAAGVQQMIRLGLELRETTTPAELLPETPGRGHVAATASNFLRTQLSARALLLGLLAPDAARAALHRLDATADADEGTGALGPAGVDAGAFPVHVAAPHAETIHAYSARPALQRAADALSQSEAFAVRERALAPRRAAISAALPYLRAGTAPFLWLHAADHFACRAAHGRPLLPGLTRADADAAHQHVDWRFRQWYSAPHVRAHATGPLLTGLMRRMQHRALGRSDERVALYAGHDVTLLPLLHALTGRAAHAWPRYAAALRLDLVRHRADPGQLFVRAFYDGAPLPLVGCAGNTCTLHHFSLIALHERRGRPLAV